MHYEAFIQRQLSISTTTKRSTLGFIRWKIPTCSCTIRDRRTASYCRSPCTSSATTASYKWWPCSFWPLSARLVGLYMTFSQKEWSKKCERTLLANNHRRPSPASVIYHNAQIWRPRSSCSSAVNASYRAMRWGLHQTAWCHSQQDVELVISASPKGCKNFHYDAWTLQLGLPILIVNWRKIFMAGIKRNYPW